ncbi:hypothetical protein EJD97_001064, partial [Solanum chilense]
ITTGEIKALPFSLGYKSDWVFARLYLGYDSNIKRYKLLRDRIYYKKRPCLKIRTLGTNTSWRRICDENSPSKLYNCYCDCVFVNGVFYWTSRDLNTITYFNVTNEKFGSLSPPHKSRVSEIQTALCGKLIVYPPDQPKNCNLVYDEVNKVFTKFQYDSDLVEEKLSFLEAENVDKRTMDPKSILATSSLISNSTYLVFSYDFGSRHVSRFVENIIPLNFIIND